MNSVRTIELIQNVTGDIAAHHQKIINYKKIKIGHTDCHSLVLRCWQPEFFFQYLDLNCSYL